MITLTGNQLESDTTGTERIVGPKGGVTINGSGASRVFQVDGGSDDDLYWPDHHGWLDLREWWWPVQ